MSQPLLELARSIAIEAAALAAERRVEGVEIAASKSSPEDIVTLADRETEALIRSRLAEARPDDAFLGEEGGADGGSSGLTWVVDPIDGTVNYAYGIPQWAVSIAVVEGDPDPETWTALAGVVVNPMSGEVYTASRGEGSFLGDRRLEVHEVELSMALVATGFSYSGAVRTEQARVVTGLIDQVRDIRRMGSAALDLCAVATGRVNAYYERGLGAWDHAAGALIASEAGASVRGLHAERASRDFTVAAPPLLSERMCGVLRELRA